MQAKLRNEDNIVIVDLDGRLVAGEAVEILRETMNELIGDANKRILLNLSQVNWIDSSGIGELVASIKLAERFGSSVKLLRVGDRVKHVLSISRLLPLLDVYEDEAEALQAFAEGSGRSLPGTEEDSIES